ncbi:MAG: hypothetical protein KAY26_03655 [Acinetobacter sp.]|nr:hypothetical protein [Acinetobacter sp.]
MLLKYVSNSIKSIVSALFICTAATSISHAKALQCDDTDAPQFFKKLCTDSFSDLRTEFNEHFHTTYLVTDAPIRLIDDTQTLWTQRVQQCKNSNCLKQQMNFRIEELNFYTSMNQSLTQHYLKFEHGKISKQPAHIKIHQLTKDRIKIEGTAYRDPNNRAESQSIPLLAYTTNENKSEILDNENDCKYILNFQKSILIIDSKTQSKNCDRFKGIYRLYD